MRTWCKSRVNYPNPHFRHPPRYHTVPYTAFFPAHCDTARASSCTHRDTVVARNGPMLIHASTTQPRPLFCCSCSGGVPFSLHSHSLALGNLTGLPEAKTFPPTTTAAAATTTTTTSATLLPPIHLQHYLRGSVTSPNTRLSLLYLPPPKHSSPFSRFANAFPREACLCCAHVAALNNSPPIPSLDPSYCDRLSLAAPSALTLGASSSSFSQNDFDLSLSHPLSTREHVGPARQGLAPPAGALP